MAKKYRSRKKQSPRSVQLVIVLLIVSVVSYLMNLYGCEILSVNGNTTYSGTTLAHEVADLDMARTAKGAPSQIIRHKGYTLSYNHEWRLANWVGYVLTAEETYGTVERSDWFAEDPQVKGVKVQHADYTHSGYDRGHMAPAADMKWDEQAMQESFYMSNICPQVHALNAGMWSSLENKARQWARRDSAIVVVCGPIVQHDHMMIGESCVAVPSHYYKVIASPYGKRPQGIAFIMPNEDLDAPLYTYATTIDSVESLTGIDFLYNLPDSLENYVEQNFDLKSWQL